MKFFKKRRKKSIGIALGSGSALGSAHIGVIKSLSENNIPIDFIAGTSIGSMIGAFYACGCFDELEKFSLSIKKKTVLSYLDMTIPYKGLISGDKIYSLLKEFFQDRTIETLEIPFAAVSTDILSGEEIDIKRGRVADAVRASISIPGIFEPPEINGKVYVDGGIVNPVPVNILREWGADIIIAVNLNRYISGSHKKNISLVKKMEEKLLTQNKNKHSKDLIKHKLNIFEIINNSSQIIQRKIGDLTFEKYPPDFLIEPRLDNFKMFDFHRAKEGIDEGYKKTEEIINEIKLKINKK